MNTRTDALRLFILAMFLSSLLHHSNPGLFAAESPVKKIIYLYDGENPHTKRISKQIRKIIPLLAKGRYTADFLPDDNAGWSPAKSAEMLKKALNNKDVDLIIVSGLNFTLAVLADIPLAKPVIVADFIDPVFLGMPQTAEGTSGVPNLTYLAKSQGVADDFAAFRKILPFKTLHVLLDPSRRRYADRILDKLQIKDFEVRIISAEGNVEKILESMGKEKIEALYLPPQRLNEQDFQKLIEEINKRKIATFSALGYDDVEKGVLSGRTPSFFTKFSRRIATSADRILTGREASSIPVAYDLTEKMLINQCTADQIGLSLPFDVLLSAEILCYGEKADSGHPVLTLKQAVKEVVGNNLNTRIVYEQIEISRKDYWLAWSNYFPGVNSSLDYGVVDSERARNISRLPKWSYQANISFNQLIFSHPVFLDISNAKKQIKVEECQRGSTDLDLTERAILAYLNYLSTKALHKVSLDNLKNIEVNLNVAQKRYKVGTGGREEVLRWESERAEKKADVLRREADIYQSRVVLNQLMNRPQENYLAEQDIGLETIHFYIGSQYLKPYVRNYKSLLAFLDFAAQEAGEKSPELQALDIGIEQQRNNIKSADGRFILPEVSLGGLAGHILKDKYDQPKSAGRNDWEFNLSMTYPLFDHGRRVINSMKQRHELRRLQYARDLRRQEIERSLRRSAYDIYASLPGIKLKKEAMARASENFDVVEKKYNEGIVNITDLIDAQTKKFDRESQAVVAIYQFLGNLASFDRELATFYMLADENTRRLWLEKVHGYLQERGVL